MTRKIVKARKTNDKSDKPIQNDKILSKKTKFVDVTANQQLIVKKRGNPKLEESNPGFKPGQSGNPAGRPRGSRNKLADAFITDLLNDWEVAGPSAIQSCRLQDPSAYCRIVAGILPKEINIKDEERVLEKFFEQFTSPEQIDAFLNGVTELGVQQGRKQIQN